MKYFDIIPPMVDLSHCCLAPMEMNAFPYTCQACEGATEPAEPSTPTHVEDVVDTVGKILEQVSQGTLSPDKAQEYIMLYFDEEIETAHSEACQEIRDKIKNIRIMPIISTPDPIAQGLIRGYDIAFQAFDAVVEKVYLNKKEE